jgi:hypothetical protein
VAIKENRIPQGSVFGVSALVLLKPHLPVAEHPKPLLLKAFEPLNPEPGIGL